MAAAGADMPINRVEMRDKSVGVITSGIPYQYVREAMPNASVLKLGMVNPLPRKMIEDFCAQVDKVYVIEELEPHIETQVRAWGIDAVGKDLLTVQGEYSANMLREKLLGEWYDELGISARPEEYFYDEYEYGQYKDMLNFTVEKQ